MKETTTAKKRGGARLGAGRPFRHGVHLERREIHLRPDVIKGISKLAERLTQQHGKRVKFSKYVEDVHNIHLIKK